MKVVVDTNVAIAANGRNTHASYSCQISCIEMLESLVSRIKNKILLDNSGLIMDEYNGYLNYRGQPGVGDIFYKYLHDNMYISTNVRLVSITPVDDVDYGYDELPRNNLDLSDRKFLAVAVVGDAGIVNAMDSDWNQQKKLLEDLGVELIQLCPDHSVKQGDAS